MTAKRVFVQWTIGGFLFAAFLLWTQIVSVGGFTGLLQVGETSPVRGLIESQLGETPLASGIGHDGQAFYVVGLELAGHDAVHLLDRPGYRFRRVLYPLASGLTFLDGIPLLIGMTVISALSMAVASGATALVAHSRGINPMVALSVVANPGVWLSVRMLTGETLALAAMTVGLAAFSVSRRHASSVAFSAAVLSKEVSLLTPLGIPFGKGRRALVVAVVPLLVLLVWSWRVEATVGSAFAGEGNISWPLLGIIEGSQLWGSQSLDDKVFLIMAVAIVVAGLLHGLMRRSWLRWSILGWCSLALVSSDLVWGLGNNAMRIFAPILMLIAVAGGEESPRNRSH